MNFLHSLYNVLYYKVQTPTLYGKFHIISLILSFVAIVFAVWLLKDVKEKSFRIFLLVIWVILVLFEVYRELAFSLSLENGIFTWDYAWYQFPFQLCGTPLYIIPIVIFAKDGTLRSACMSFLAVWSLFGGLVVILYPGDIFISYIGICIQSYFHHAMQVLIGIVIAVRVAKKRGLNRRFFLSGLCVFLLLFAAAMLMNYLAYHALVARGMDDEFNMFFISPYFECTLPVLSEIQKITSYPVFLLTYLVGFSVIAALIFCVEKILCDKFVKSEV